MGGDPIAAQPPSPIHRIMSAAGSSPRVRRTMMRIKTLEASANDSTEEVQPTTKKAAQKLTNFRAYLQKSSVAGCFVDLLEMTSEGVMTEAGLYPSSRYKDSRNKRLAGLGPRSHARHPAGIGGTLNIKETTPRDPSLNQIKDDYDHHQEEEVDSARCTNGGGGRGRCASLSSVGGEKLNGNNESNLHDVPDLKQTAGGGPQKQQHQQRGKRRQRPSTALVTPNPPMLAHAPDAPLSSRVADPAGHLVGARARTLSRSPPLSTKAVVDGGGGPGGGGGGDKGVRDIQRTKWLQGGVKGKEGGWLEEGEPGQPQQDNKVVLDEPQIIEAVRDAGQSDGACMRQVVGTDEGADKRRKTSMDSEPPSRPKIAWAKSMRELTTTVTKVTQIKAAAARAATSRADERVMRAAKARAALIEGEKLRAQALLLKNENRKQMAMEAAALAASQRGLLGVITLVLATKRIWAAGMKLSQHYEKQAELATAATVVQRAFKAYSHRRIFKVLLSIRRVNLKLHIGINIRRKRMAVTKMTWFFMTGSGGAKARPRKVIRAFIYQVRRCQRAAREWLACRAASIEAVCRLWDRIETEIRKGLGKELDRAKAVWMKNTLRTGADSDMHGKWRELKAKTRSLIARIDRLETQIDRQQRRDKAARMNAARVMLKKRLPPGLNGVTRGRRRVTQVDSAEDLRTSSVPSGKRLAIIRSSLQAKFLLHLQGGSRRVERTGNKAIGEMEARLLIQGDFPGTPPGEGSEGGAPAPMVRSTKRSRALIYTGDLGRSWEQIVEETVMQDFKRNAFARKDSMPYLKYSPVLSLETLVAAAGEGPSVAFAPREAASTNASGSGGGGGGSSSRNNNGAIESDGLGGSGHTPALEQRRRRRRQGSAGGGGAARVVLEPIL